MSNTQVKVYDKAESEQTKIESTKIFVENAKVDQEIILVHEAENNGVRVSAISTSNGSVEVEGLKPNHDLDIVFYSNIYEMLCDYPIIHQYQDSYEVN